MSALLKSVFKGGEASAPSSPRGNRVRSGGKMRAESIALASKEHLLAVLRVIKSVNRCHNLQEAIDKIVTETCAILDCDRATLFMVDTVREQLVIKVAVGAKDICVPWDKGIVGHVYQNGEHMNIPDAYKSDLFNSAVDKQTGYTTKSILATPIHDADGHIVAVLQAINKKSLMTKGDFTAFTEEDVMLLDHLSGQMGVILRNCAEHEMNIIQRRKTNAMLSICKALYGELGINSVMFTITESAPKLVDADRCTMYLHDPSRKELTSMHGAVEIRIPDNVGLAGSVIGKRDVINIKDAYLDERFDQEYDKKSGYRTRAVLCAPIFGSKGDVIGVLQLINKLHEDHYFTSEDEGYVTSFLEVAGQIIEKSQIFHHQKKIVSEFEKLQVAKASKSHDHMSAMQATVIEEGDEDEEDEDEDED